MMSKSTARLIELLPEKLVIKIARNKINGYLKKYAKINVSGYENIKKADGPKIFISNHLSNSDGFIIEKVLKDEYDPTFVAGVKLSNDPVTNLGTKVVKNISIKRTFGFYKNFHRIEFLKTYLTMLEKFLFDDLYYRINKNY